MVIPLENLGEVPAFIDCPYCQKRTKTKTSHKDSSQTMMAAIICCLCCGLIGVCVPSLCGWCADTSHACSECNKPVAHRPYDGKTQAIYPVSRVAVPSQFAPLPKNLVQDLPAPVNENSTSHQASSATAVPATDNPAMTETNHSSTPVVGTTAHKA